MTYLINMAMLLMNAQADMKMQERIDLARIECAHSPELQLALDRKQTALDEAVSRNLTHIMEIARIN